MSKLNPRNIPALLILTGIGFGMGTLLDARVQVAERGPVTARQNAQQNPSPGVQQEKTRFIRVTHDARGEPQAMQTAITRYRPHDGELVVDLIGAVHIGESNYYHQLNNQFKHYDVVLYELVAPEGTRVPRGGKQKNAVPASPLDLVAWMQHQAQSTLGLESQLEKIDYQASNLRHADLSPAQMSQKMAERGDTPLTIGLSALTEMMRQQNRSAKKPNTDNRGSKQLDSTNLLDLLGDPLKMKRMMASQFADAGVMDLGMGATLNQLLVVDRNVAALKVLQKEITNGQKKIAIFYGAAHMPDFEQRLASEFGLKKTKQVWIDAWNLSSSGARAPAENPANMLLKLLDELSR